MNDYKIWLNYDKAEDVHNYPLEKGGAYELFTSYCDVKGKNINELSPVCADLVAMYYVWKNNKKSSFVGFSHCNRKFGVASTPEKGECQVGKIIDFGSQTIYEQYAMCHNSKDMDIVLSILESNYGTVNEYSQYIKNGHCLISNSSFLMKWQDFTKLCKFVFQVIDSFSEQCCCKSVDDWKKKVFNDFGRNSADYQLRVVSFIAERLISAWIYVNLTPYVEGRNVAIVHYNTPELLEAAIKSLNKHTQGCRIFVFDNSDKRPFSNNFKNVKVLDNTCQQLVNFDEELERYPNKWESDIAKSNYGSAKHSMSVEYLMEVIPDGFVLMDSDVLITSDIKDMWNKNVACVGSENVKHNIPLLMPFLCYLNVPELKNSGVSYYNGDKMWALSNVEPNCFYDTGAWLLEQVREKGLRVEYINIWRYVIHLGHGSWRDRNTEQWLEENRNMYE